MAADSRASAAAMAPFQLAGPCKIEGRALAGFCLSGCFL